MGAIVLVACGNGAAGRLRAAGDTYADSDAASCAQWSQQCYSSSKNDAVPQIADVRLQKFADGTWGYNGSVCVRPVRPVVTARMVRARVSRLIASAAVGLAPKTSTLVNIQTLMWVATSAQRDLPVIVILGQRVVVHLRVDHVVYDFGDGVTDDRGPIGKVYDAVGDPCRVRLCPDYYGHVYAHRGRYTVTATVQWNASFSVAGGRAQQIPGTVAGPASRARIRVREAQAVLVPNP